MNYQRFKRLLALLTVMFICIGFPVSGGELRPDYTNSSECDSARRPPGSDMAGDGVLLTPAALNPEFIAYSECGDGELYFAGDEGTPGGHACGIVPHPLDLSHSGSTGVCYADDSVYRGLSSSYDLRELGRVSSVKDQRLIGSCWAYATYSSLESYLLPGENQDFSENHMKNLLSDRYPEGLDRSHNEGGNHFKSTAYLARWTGPVNEIDDPYDPISGVSPPGLAEKKHVQEVYFLPDRKTALDNDMIKWAVREMGAVYTSVRHEDGSYNPLNTSYCYLGVRASNHAVSIVGWDDGYSRTKFQKSPPGNGAFIVKNNWGPYWGDRGYYYISYYDTNIGTKNAVFTAEPVDNYDRIYQYDPLGLVNNHGYSSPTGWFANVFTARGYETLEAVSLYTSQTNADYELFVYLEPSSGPINSKGPVENQKGVITHMGYHTIRLNNPVSLKAGKDFSVVVKLMNPGYNSPIPVEYPERGFSKAVANAGESFVSRDGMQWNDLTEEVNNGNVCLKAFTSLGSGPDIDFSANITTGVCPLSVVFTDLSDPVPENWTWSFGDGSSSGLQHPVHTYQNPGIYDVGLTVKNSFGSGTIVKEGYITVTRPEGYRVSIALSKGWNMFSLPLDEAELTVPASVVRTAYRYDPVEKSYVGTAINSMEAGKGYWVAATADCVLTVQGKRLDRYSCAIKKGWNMIGALSDDISFNNPDTYPSESLLPYVWRYNPAAKSYSSSLTVLEPGKGYWVAAKNDCLLYIGY